MWPVGVPHTCSGYPQPHPPVPCAVPGNPTWPSAGAGQPPKSSAGAVFQGDLSAARRGGEAQLSVQVGPERKPQGHLVPRAQEPKQGTRPPREWMRSQPHTLQHLPELVEVGGVLHLGSGFIRDCGGDALPRPWGTEAQQTAAALPPGSAWWSASADRRSEPGPGESTAPHEGPCAGSSEAPPLVAAPVWAGI